MECLWENNGVQQGSDEDPLRHGNLKWQPREREAKHPGGIGPSQEGLLIVEKMYAGNPQWSPLSQQMPSILVIEKPHSSHRP